MSKKFYILDLEGNGFTPDYFHCMSIAWKTEEGLQVKSTTDPEKIKEFFLKEDEDRVLVGHNLIVFDISEVERVLGIKVPKSTKIWDTMALSWYLSDKRKNHKLGGYGDEYGLSKIEIDDWVTLPVERYIERCERDVHINYILFAHQLDQLTQLYGSEEEVLRLVDYLSFKMKCVQLQAKSKWRVDMELCEKNLNILSEKRAQKIETLIAIMPKIPIESKMSKPKVLYNNKGELSASGKKWFNKLKELGHSDDFEGPAITVKGWEEPNPISGIQVKTWLFSLNWQPKTFKETNLKDGSKNKVPQLFKANKEPCDSILLLAEKDPGIIELNELGILTARIGLLKGFLSNQKDGFLTAKIAGIANTMRMKHAEIVNIPKTSVPYGVLIKECLSSPEGSELVECDLSSLENYTKYNFINKIDPEYVKEAMDPEHDPHLSLASHKDVKMMTPDEVEFFKWYKKEEKKKAKLNNV